MLALVKGNREPHEAKKKSFDLGGNRTHDIHVYPYFLFAAIHHLKSSPTFSVRPCNSVGRVTVDLIAAIHHLKSSPTFSVRPCNSVGRVTVDLIRRSWVRFPPRSKDFFFASCGSLFPLLGLTPSGLFMGLSSTLIYTSELILCSIICVPSATRHNIHMYQNVRRDLYIMTDEVSR